MTDQTIAGRRSVLARLLRLARHSARAGKPGHWSYDAQRHIEILAALNAERAAMAARLAAACRQNVLPTEARFGIST